MYAYKQKLEYNGSSVYNDRYSNMQSPFYNQQLVRRKVVKKKNNSFQSLLILLVFFAFVGCCLIPFSLKNVKSLFCSTTNSFNFKRGTESVFDKSIKSSVNTQALLFPTLSYLKNDMFLNQYLLASRLSGKKYTDTMFESERMIALENNLKILNKSFPMIKPSIYVWSFETGNYAAINEHDIYPAASIIKIPVLVQLFKSIEANQVTIYDDMVLTDYYRASGSGDIQYAQQGRKYSLDSLAKVMIQNSDNSATNMLISKLGGIDDINSGIRSWGLKNTYINTWLPDLTGNNKTTAYDIAKILCNFENADFLNINSREDIIRYMSKVKNNRLIQAGLPQGTPFIHKTGDIGSMLGDAGIVYMPNGQHYIVVILAYRPHNNHAGVEFIQAASTMIYKAMSLVQ